MPIPRINRPIRSVGLLLAAANIIAPIVKTTLASKVVGFLPILSFNIPPTKAKIAAAPTTTMGKI